MPWPANSKGVVNDFSTLERDVNNRIACNGKNDFDQGYDDAIDGKPNTSNCNQYNKGYSCAYKLKERQSVKHN